MTQRCLTAGVSLPRDTRVGQQCGDAGLLSKCPSLSCHAGKMRAWGQRGAPVSLGCSSMPGQCREQFCKATSHHPAHVLLPTCPPALPPPKSLPPTPHPGPTAQGLARAVQKSKSGDEVLVEQAASNTKGRMEVEGEGLRGWGETGALSMSACPGEEVRPSSPPPPLGGGENLSVGATPLCPHVPGHAEPSQLARKRFSSDGVTPKP